MKYVDQCNQSDVAPWEGYQQFLFTMVRKKKPKISLINQRYNNTKKILKNNSKTPIICKGLKSTRLVWQVGPLRFHPTYTPDHPDSDQTFKNISMSSVILCPLEFKREFCNYKRHGGILQKAGSSIGPQKRSDENNPG